MTHFKVKFYTLLPTPPPLPTTYDATSTPHRPKVNMSATVSNLFSDKSNNLRNLSLKGKSPNHWPVQKKKMLSPQFESRKIKWVKEFKVK